MKTRLYPIAMILITCLFFSCEKDDKNNDKKTTEYNDTVPSLSANNYIGGYEVALEQILRAIPENYLQQVRNNLHVAYQHTSHGTHVAYGLYGLPHYKAGDDVLFAVDNEANTESRLDFRDHAISGANDLGSPDETAFIDATRNYLDDPGNAAINVVMWSWCDISGHDVANNYLPGMQTLINEYGPGGTKIGSGSGQRATPVTFIFMTGHGNPGSNVCDGCPKNQADLIRNYCVTHNYYCLDYYGIDTHDMDGNYREDAGDDGNSDSYGGHFYADWQSTHTLGVHYYENLGSLNGDVSYGDHTNQHITSNRKAYAMWYILSRIAGWDGTTTN